MIIDQTSALESLGLIEGTPEGCLRTLLKTEVTRGNNLLFQTDLKQLKTETLEKYGDVFNWHLNDSQRSLNTDIVNDPKFEFSYNNRMIKHFGINQLDLALQQLVIEKRSRPIVMWDPKIDLQEKHLIPCLSMISLWLDFDKVNMCVVFRSRDIIRRLIPNWNALQFFQERVAKHLSMNVGTLSDFSISWFYRNEDLERLKKIL